MCVCVFVYARVEGMTNVFLYPFQARVSYFRRISALKLVLLLTLALMFVAPLLVTGAGHAHFFFLRLEALKWGQSVDSFCQGTGGR